ncbi:hypothetical protein [Macrococcoides canis]|nr:hypothetical protein [Macrococcus canis]
MANKSELIIKGNKIELELLNNIGNEGIKEDGHLHKKYHMNFSIP